MLGRTGCWLCPVAALAAYLAVRSWSVGPLFRFESGAPLSRSALVIFVRAALRQAGLPAASYSGHSFRIGAQPRRLRWVWRTPRFGRSVAGAVRRFIGIFVILRRQSRIFLAVWRRRRRTLCNRCLVSCVFGLG